MTNRPAHIAETENTLSEIQKEINSKAGMLLLEALPFRRACVDSILEADVRRFANLADRLVSLRSMLADSKLQLDALRRRSG